jgi:hypothetical protein
MTNYLHAMIRVGQGHCSIMRKESLDTPTSAIALAHTIYGVERKIEYVSTGVSI